MNFFFFFWNLMFWDGFRGHFWTYNNTLSLQFSPGMVTEVWFGSSPHGWRLVCISIGSFRDTQKNMWKGGARKPCFAFSLYHIFQAMSIENVLPPRSKPALCSSLLHSDHEVVRAWICADNIYVSCLQVKGWRHHLSQNIGPAVTRSAGPAQPPL